MQTSPTRRAQRFPLRLAFGFAFGVLVGFLAHDRTLVHTFFASLAKPHPRPRKIAELASIALMHVRADACLSALCVQPDAGRYYSPRLLRRRQTAV